MDDIALPEKALDEAAKKFFIIWGFDENTWEDMEEPVRRIFIKRANEVIQTFMKELE